VVEKSFLLLSASQDFSVRLWHALHQLQICIFGGPLGGHLAEVNSVSWHFSGDYFVSAGNDCYIKIWHLTENLNNNIELSKKVTNRQLKHELKFKTIIKTKPTFSCNTVHENWVDCVKFNGNFILSKSVDGVIFEWQPIFNPGSDSFFLINTYIFNLNEQIWYMKFGVETLERNLLAIGNEVGQVFLFRLNQEEKEEKFITSGKSHDKNERKDGDWKEKYFDSHKYFNRQEKLDVWQTPIRNVLRCVFIDDSSNTIVVGGNEGLFFVSELLID
jgi:WD40 repeat protein